MSSFVSNSAVLKNKTYIYTYIHANCVCFIQNVHHKNILFNFFKNIYIYNIYTILIFYSTFSISYGFDFLFFSPWKNYEKKSWELRHFCSKKKKYFFLFFYGRTKELPFFLSLFRCYSHIYPSVYLSIYLSIYFYLKCGTPPCPIKGIFDNKLLRHS